MVSKAIPSKTNKTTAETDLERMLKRIRQSEEFPSISKYLIEINQKLSACQDASDASDLANVILNDYALTNKLLKLVNSAYYGLAAGKVTTVTRAVVVLGYEHVRLATVSLALFEHFQSKSHTANLKEALVASFWAGIVARDIANMDAAVDPEEAFLCAMLIQLGKLVMIYYLPDEYRKVADWMAVHGNSETKAVKAACGVSYETLGKAVAGQWNFPSSICEGLQSLSRDELRNKRKPPTQLRVLADFIKNMGFLIQKGGLAGDDRGLQSLLDRYKDRIKISKRQLTELLANSIGTVQKHAQALNFSIENSVFIHSLAAFCQPPEQSSAAADVSQGDALPTQSHQLTDRSAFKSSAAGKEGLTAIDMIMEGIEEISEAMMSESDVNDLALMSLEIIYRALGFQRALMFAREADGHTMTVRFGYGHHSQRLARKAGFKVREAKDLFNQSVHTGKDLIVADAYDPNTVSLVPSWYRTHIDAPAFIFLPIAVQGVCIGAFYADRNRSGHPIGDVEFRHLNMLRNQLLLAIKYRQGAK